MQKTDSHQSNKALHRKVKSSTTLSRKYVRRPQRTTDMMTTPANSNAKIAHFASSSIALVAHMPRNDNAIHETQQAEVHPVQRVANQKMQQRKISIQYGSTTPKTSAKELKDRAIKKALASAEKNEPTSADSHTTAKKQTKMHFGFGRIMLALSCATVVVCAIVYFVNMSMPDISLRVAAMQTGIDASYPSYVPRDYALSGITSENGKITLNFTNSADGGAFTLVEETSSWDSNALLSNFVKTEYGDNYSIIREQGLTIYISGSDASWVNGGVVYKLNTTAGTLTNKQIKSIATSL